MHQPDVLFVIPALNEAGNLPAVIQELRAAWPDARLLVVSDASVDATVEVARAQGAQTVSLPFHLGYGGAVQTGIKYGIRKRMRVVVTFDADGQHDPADVGPLVEAVHDGADVAIGSRALAAGSYRGGI
ncbi:MAG TPA: glycosyltransferase family 2 protein, partial [Vicinamibacteria bacterium]|nr:glycosyltransferase family 2 protein [Vicinamibacteria bacterium]